MNKIFFFHAWELNLHSVQLCLAGIDEEVMHTYPDDFRQKCMTDAMRFILR